MNNMSGILGGRAVGTNVSSSTVEGNVVGRKLSVLGKPMPGSFMGKMKMPNLTHKNNSIVSKLKMPKLAMPRLAIPDRSSLLSIKGQAKVSKFKLSKTGDFDKDGVMNMLDCRPFDRTKQGVLHKTANFLKGRGYQEKLVQPNERGQMTDYSTGRYVTQTTPTDYPTSNVEDIKNYGGAAVGALGRGLKSGAKNLYQASGAKDMVAARGEQKDINRQKLAVQKSILDKAQESGSLSSGDQQALGFLAGVTQKSGIVNKISRGVQKFDNADRGFRTNLREVSGGLSAATNPLQAGNKISGLIGIGRGYGAAQALQSRQPSLSYEQKVTGLVGRSKHRRQIEAESQLMGIQQPMGQPQYQQSQSQSQYQQPQGQPQNTENVMYKEGVRYEKQQDGKWLNTKTGGTVSYPRGSYNKHKQQYKTQQYNRPQEVQQQNYYQPQVM